MTSQFIADNKVDSILHKVFDKQYRDNELSWQP